MSPTVHSLDHLVLTVTNIDATVTIYQDVLGMEPFRFPAADGSTRWALSFGDQKINLHALGREFEPRAASTVAGSADLCFLSSTPLAAWQAHLEALGVPVEEGPVARTGATGPIRSLYLRDPDRNLIEISNRV